MTSNTGNQSAQSSQSSQITSKAQADAASVHPAKSSNTAGKPPVKRDQAEDIDQLIGYLD
ncbi:MAG: hypothetical protein BRC44_01100 [Cyanobacteria bacterium QS_4_48_99]|nr:MAG: hypothetical protein BRC44_01100 [Cyanobacteria bacterium QS_4_48_99]